MNRNNKNYAQAAAAQSKTNNNNTHHQNQQHHHQQVPQQNQTSGTSTSSNFSSSANGKSNKSQTKPQAQHNSTMGNGNTSRSTPIKQKNPVQLPTNGHSWEKKTSIEFGSINTPNAQISSLPTSTGPTLTSGGGIPTTLPTKGVPTFGTLSNTTTTQTIQAAQTTPTTIGTSGGANNNNSNSNSNNNNNNNNGVVPKSISARVVEIPRTQSAPPQFQDNRNVGQSGHITNVPRTNNIHQQQSAGVSHQQSSVSVSNTPLNHRKDSVSSTVSSNDGQPPFHPHHSPHHNHNPNHHHYGRQHQHHKQNMGPPNQYRPRDNKNVTHPSPHLNPAQSVPTQGVLPITAPQIYMNYRPTDYPMPFYPGYHHPVHPNQIYIPQTYMQPRPPQMQPHLTQVPSVSFKPPSATSKSKAIEIIDPNKGAPIQIKPQQISKSPVKREEPAAPVVKQEESDKEKPNSAVPIIDPAEKDKEERERKEREEQAKVEQERKEKEEKERKAREEREEQERIAKEKEQERIAKEKEEQERKEREERERKEREERERKEREERERKEREERERKEREEREERERKEREELERKEREERERKEREERERKEREERERKEREEQERKEKEEKERKEREEREKKEREERLEKERLEKEEQERKEREEKERLEKEKERLEAERIEKERKAAEEKARKEQEEKEKEEAEKKKKEEEEAKAKAAAEGEKKKEKEAESNDSKKEEKKYGKGNRPGPLDLSRTTSAPIPSAPLSALGSARKIDDINSVQYPEGISSPNPDLNVNSEPGKFKYDRSFLMQFMGVCREKPENLPALEAIGMEEPKDDRKKSSRPGTSRSNSMHKNSPQFSNMGEFKFPPKTSEERFAVATSNMRNGAPSVFGRLGGRTGSGSTLLPAPAMSATPQSPSRTSSGRGATRKGGKGSHQVQTNVGEHVAPLERSENRWVPGPDPLIRTDERAMHLDSIRRKVKALLNKLTLEKFDSISDQIIEFANKSREEKNGCTLREVIRLIFEKSCDESNFCAMYAQLCRKMMERVDPEIVDENVKNTEGKFVQGGTLFRKYLLNRCQEDFEKGWKVNIPVPSNEKGEPDLMSDEYYVAAKAKRQGLGLIRFIGELFKLNMLTERIMHECIKKLLIFQGSPEEEEMESLCKLMNTVGEQLDHVKTNQHEQIKANQIDHGKAKQLMENYFARMEEITKLPNLSSRIKFMIMDVIDLRNNAWKPRRDINAPKTIAEIHEDAAKQKEEAEYLRRTASSGGKLPKISEQMSRSGSGRRDHKGMASHGSSSPGNDGWINVGGSSSQRKDKVGDLSKFGLNNRGKISGNNFSLSPGGIQLSGGAKGWKSDNKADDHKTTVLSRTNSLNTYSILESSEGRKSEPSISEVPKPSPLTERKKLNLIPRSKPFTSEETQADKSTPKSNSETVSSVQSMSEDLAVKRIKNMEEEYFSVLDIKEVLECFKEIPETYHARAIESFANKVIEQKQKDVDNVTKLFKEMISSGTCNTETFKKGFDSTLEFLMDIGADAPMSYSFTGQLLYSAGLDFRDIVKLVEPFINDDKSIEKIVKGYTSSLKNDVDEKTYAQKIKEFDFKEIFPKKNKDDINKYLEDLVR